MASKKRNFVLKNIDIEAVYNKYGLTIVSNLEKEQTSLSTTKIHDVITHDIEKSIIFLDENKKESKCVATMIELSSNNSLPDSTNIKCFWCKYNFDTKPIGCPIKYVNPLIEKSYVSQITKDTYYMRENIVQSKLDKISTKDNQFQIEIYPFNHYLTDGIFCSFNCVLSFIKDNNHNIFYKESYSLLHCLYYDLVGKKIAKIIPSPHWRLLKDFGGPFTIEEFRKNLNTIDYKFMFNLREMKSISKVYKES
jgi:hypothetical protein